MNQPPERPNLSGTVLTTSSSTRKQNHHSTSAPVAEEGEPAMMPAADPHHRPANSSSSSSSVPPAPSQRNVDDVWHDIMRQQEEEEERAPPVQEKGTPTTLEEFLLSQPRDEWLPQHPQAMPVFTPGIPPMFLMPPAVKLGGECLEGQGSARTEEVVDKTAERKQKRMIKNRESAARSRAKKQAYINQLEEKERLLKAANEILKKKKAWEMKLIQNPCPVPDRYQLRRTRSAPP